MPVRATLNGEIATTGGINCDERGFDWGESSGNLDQHPTTEKGTFGTGSFSLVITGLESNKTYYFKAKAHNSIGWGYGLEKSFSTPTPSVVKWQTTTSSVALVPLHIRRLAKW
jgi:hypothetical protein